MVDAVSGEGRMGRAGFVSTLKERMRETGSAPLPGACACWWWANARNGEDELGERFRRIVARSAVSYVVLCS